MTSFPKKKITIPCVQYHQYVYNLRAFIENGVVFDEFVGFVGKWKRNLGNHGNSVVC